MELNYKRIMVVDDSKTARMMIMEIINMAGFEGKFIEASDGLDAITQLVEGDEKVDLVITDFIMPRINGASFIKRLRLVEDCKNIPVILITSLGAQAIALLPEDSRVIAAIQKPLTLEKLNDAMEALSQ